MSELQNLIQAAEIYKNSRDVEDNVSPCYWFVDTKFTDIVDNPLTETILDIKPFFNFGKSQISCPFSSTNVVFRSFKKLQHRSFDKETQTGSAMVDLRINRSFWTDNNVGFMIAYFEKGVPSKSYSCCIVLANTEKSRDAMVGYKEVSASYGTDPTKIIMQYEGPYNTSGSARIRYFNEPKLDIYCNVFSGFVINKSGFFVNKTSYPYQYYGSSSVKVYRDYDKTMKYNNIPITGSDLDDFNSIDTLKGDARKSFILKNGIDVEAKRKADEAAEVKRKADEAAEVKRKADEAEAKIKADDAESKRNDKNQKEPVKPKESDKVPDKEPKVPDKEPKVPDKSSGSSDEVNKSSNFSGLNSFYDNNSNLIKGVAGVGALYMGYKWFNKNKSKSSYDDSSSSDIRRSSRRRFKRRNTDDISTPIKRRRSTRRRYGDRKSSYRGRYKY